MQKIGIILLQGRFLNDLFLFKIPLGRVLIINMENPTELSEIKNLEGLCNKAILEQQTLNLEKLPMVSWNEQLDYSEKYDKSTGSGIFRHVYYICQTILPKIFHQAPENEIPFMRLALSEGLRNAFEKGDELGETDVIMEHTDLKITPIEFIIHSSRKEISPYFAKYWKFLKEMKKSGKLVFDPLHPDMSLSFYHYSGIIPTPPNQGLGLVVILNNTFDCGFYRSLDNTLMTRMVFDKRT
jgi:hypothetical protein